MKLTLICQGRHHCTGPLCPRYCLCNRPAVTWKLQVGKVLFFLPNSINLICQIDVSRQVLSILLAICLFSSIFAKFCFLVYSAVFSLFSFDLLVYYYPIYLSFGSLITILSHIVPFPDFCGTPLSFLQDFKILV